MRLFTFAVLALLGIRVAAAATAGGTLQNETLDYSIVWPSGLSLGEAHWKSHNEGTVNSPMWNFELSFDARVPGFALIDSLHSETAEAFCTERFKRDLEHGPRKSGESIDVDRKGGKATRKPANGGGESEVKIPDCVRDPLAFLFFTRQELLSGRIPNPQPVLYGALYQVRLSNLGVATVTSGSRKTEADRIGCEIQGPTAHWNAEIFFARDSVRTPVLVKIPMSLGTFALELER